MKSPECNTELKRSVRVGIEIDYSHNAGAFDYTEAN